jgi:hypothetical protein
VPDLGVSPNAAVAYDFLVSKGLSCEQAAGVIGNLQLESGLNPRLEAMDTNNKMSRGIAMWQPTRWQNLLTFAAGRDPWALGTQLDFLWYELQSQPSLGLQQLLATTTAQDATVVFQNRFENPRADLAHTDKRIAAANAALYSCPTINSPTRSGSLVAATVGVFALVAAVGYGTYKILSTREREPDIGPEPPPVFRPNYGNYRTTWKP